MRVDVWGLADEIEAEPGEVLVRNGAPVGHVFAIRSGSAEIREDDSPRLLGPGAVFDTTNPGAVVVACSAMRLLVVDVRRATAVLGCVRNQPMEMT